MTERSANQGGEQNGAGGQMVLDVGEQRVARVYAEALLNAAAKQGQPEAVLQEIDALTGELFRTDPQIEAFFTSGTISRGRRAEVLRSAFQGRVSDTFLNFLLVLNDHDRLGMIRALRQAAWELHNERAGLVQVRVVSAVPLPADQMERLKQTLRETFAREPVVEARVDPDILGGLVVQVGDWLLDASIRTHMLDLRNQLFARSSHEIQTRRDRFSSAG
jgi:F-type H+-transporting ATPase subunit delta